MLKSYPRWCVFFFFTIWYEFLAVMVRLRDHFTEFPIFSQNIFLYYMKYNTFLWTYNIYILLNIINRNLCVLIPGTNVRPELHIGITMTLFNLGKYINQFVLCFDVIREIHSIQITRRIRPSQTLYLMRCHVM